MSFLNKKRGRGCGGLSLTDACRENNRHPPIGTVGLTEPQAREKYGDAVKICAQPLFHTRVIAAEANLS